jgi:hypothetical protein
MIRKIQITIRTKFDINIKCQGIRLKKKSIKDLRPNTLQSKE